MLLYLNFSCTCVKLRTLTGRMPTDRPLEPPRKVLEMDAQRTQRKELLLFKGFFDLTSLNKCNCRNELVTSGLAFRTLGFYDGTDDNSQSFYKFHEMTDYNSMKNTILKITHIIKWFHFPHWLLGSMCLQFLRISMCLKLSLSCNHEISYQKEFDVMVEGTFSNSQYWNISFTHTNKNGNVTYVLNIGIWYKESW